MLSFSVITDDLTLSSKDENCFLHCKLQRRLWSFKTCLQTHFSENKHIIRKSKYWSWGETFWFSDILMSGDMKLLQLVLGSGGSLCNYSVHGIGSIKTTRGQITCYCPRKMLLPRMWITPRKLIFYYTCKLGVISIKYVIRCSKRWNIILRSRRQFNLNVNNKIESEVVSFSVHCLMTWYVYTSQGTKLTLVR